MRARVLAVLLAAPILAACGQTAMTPEQSLREGVRQFGLAEASGDRQELYSHMDMTSPACLSAVDALDAVSPDAVSVMLKQGRINSASAVIRMTSDTEGTAGTMVFRRVDGSWLSRC